MKRLLPLAVLVTMALLAAPALAQDAPAETEAPAPDATVAEATPLEATTEPAPAPAPVVAEDPEADDDESGFRWGITGMFGGAFVGSASGYAGGLEARFGYQINSLLGIYAQPVLFAGAATADNATSAAAFAYYGVGILGDAKFARILYAGLGPELLSGGFAAADVRGSAVAAAGTRFGFELRGGVKLGGFTVGVEFHTIFTPNDPTFVPMLGLGYDSF